MTEWQKQNIEHYRQYQRDYRRLRSKVDQEFKVRVTKHSEQARKRPEGRFKEFARKFKGLSRELFETLEATPTCQICERPFSALVQKHYDHDHETGNIRGVLCKDCNIGLGFFKDNVNTLVSAQKYLLNHEER